MQIHQHVVHIYGFILDKGDHAGILIENCEGGSLKDGQLSIVNLTKYTISLIFKCQRPYFFSYRGNNGHHRKAGSMVELASCEWSVIPTLAQTYSSRRQTCKVSSKRAQQTDFSMLLNSERDLLKISDLGDIRKTKRMLSQHSESSIQAKGTVTLLALKLVSNLKMK